MTMIATMGALRRPITPYPHTLPPPPLNLGESSHGVILPPPTGLETPTAVPIPPALRHLRFISPWVLQALIRAHQVDSSQDQAYMPYPHTTLAEAMVYLRHHSYVLVQGGRITYLAGQATLRMWDEVRRHEVSWQEVETILTANYPSPPAPTLVEENDTLPCPPPKPIPREGMGLYAKVPFGGDIDDIRSDQWELMTFTDQVLHQLLYVGDLALEGMVVDVWWSLPLGVYLAQHVPPQPTLETT